MLTHFRKANNSDCPSIGCYCKLSSWQLSRTLSAEQSPRWGDCSARCSSRITSSRPSLWPAALDHIQNGVFTYRWSNAVPPTPHHYPNRNAHPRSLFYSGYFAEKIPLTRYRTGRHLSNSTALVYYTRWRGDPMFFSLFRYYPAENWSAFKSSVNNSTSTFLSSVYEIGLMTFIFLVLVFL